MQPSKFVAKVLPMEAFGESAGGGGASRPKPHNTPNVRSGSMTVPAIDGLADRVDALATEILECQRLAVIAQLLLLDRLLDRQSDSQAG